MGKLTTHVLDTANGCPAAGLAVSLYRCGQSSELLMRLHTNADGRLDHPLLQDAALVAGVYELRFEAGAYFRTRGGDLPEPPFVDEVRLRFGVADPAQDYHVPLLVSPWSYSTYRGS
ncbi:MAG: hydroxyisourate hydrolase [Solimonas sp.]